LHAHPRGLSWKKKPDNRTELKQIHRKIAKSGKYQTREGSVDTKHAIYRKKKEGNFPTMEPRKKSNARGGTDLEKDD